MCVLIVLSFGLEDKVNKSLMFLGRSIFISMTIRASECKIRPRVCTMLNPRATLHQVSGWGEKVYWCNLIWFKGAVPRYSFVAWLAIRGALKTKDKLVEYGVTTDATCCLCGTHGETHHHLFFHCSYSKLIWFMLVKRLGLSFRVTQTWTQTTNWLCSHMRGTDLKGQLRKLSFTAATYYIWQERNNRVFRSESRQSTRLALIIIDNIRRKIGCNIKAVDNPVNRSLVEAWSLSI